MCVDKNKPVKWRRWMTQKGRGRIVGATSRRERRGFEVYDSVMQVRGVALTETWTVYLLLLQKGRQSLRAQMQGSE